MTKATPTIERGRKWDRLLVSEAWRFSESALDACKAVTDGIPGVLRPGRPGHLFGPDLVDVQVAHEHSAFVADVYASLLRSGSDRINSDAYTTDPIMVREARRALLGER